MRRTTWKTSKSIIIEMLINYKYGFLYLFCSGLIFISLKNNTCLSLFWNFAILLFQINEHLLAYRLLIIYNRKSQNHNRNNLFIYIIISRVNYVKFCILSPKLKINSTWCGELHEKLQVAEKGFRRPNGSPVQKSC